MRNGIEKSGVNKKGVYNRSKLTRMVDEEWDKKKVWSEGWESKGETGEETVDHRMVVESRKGKSVQPLTRPAKKRKL
jgi:hypothetical protein